MELINKLERYLDELQTLFPDATWYGQKSDLTSIDTPSAVLTYTTEAVSADAKQHFSYVTLTVYLINSDTHTYELAHDLNYSAVTEPDIDEKLNITAAFQKRVIIM